MKITVLEGSPQKIGSSNMLAEEFARGAREAGHKVIIIDAARADIHSCTGCVKCGYEGPCVLKDDMEQIKKTILSSDMIVFVTPLYYYGMTAQLKKLIDRFCSFNGSMSRRGLKTAMIAVAWNNDDWTFDALESHYDTLVKYLNFKDEGRILGRGCGTPEMTKRSRYPKLAHEFGRSLK